MLLQYITSNPIFKKTERLIQKYKFNELKKLTGIVSQEQMVCIEYHIPWKVQGRCF